MNMIAKDPSFQQEEMGLSRVEYAYRKIKNNITTNLYPSGFQILEPELAEKLGVSRTPVREALIRLEADKLIQLIPRRGMKVNSLEVKDVKEIADLIQALVYKVVDHLCSDSSQSDYTDVDIFMAELTQLENKAEQASWALLEEKFMIALASQANNHRLQASLFSLLEQVRRVKVVVYGFEHSRAGQLASLEKFVSALKSNQADQAKLFYNEYLEDLIRLAVFAKEKKGVEDF